MILREMGTVEGSELLISDLYLSLRRVVNEWALVTNQTAQARMGYVGQHLVSVVTGYPGGKSGARGRDLLINREEFAEIKTCYRVDQLGSCNSCQAKVAGIELFCPECESTDLKRNDDSKWLIGIRNDDEFASILKPTSYYLVLLDFDADGDVHDIRASIWAVDPKCAGFALCMVDYYRNIRPNSVSNAAFNLWPFSLKFFLMRPVLVYRSIIAPDDTIRTVRFPGRDASVEEDPLPLAQYARSRNLSPGKMNRITERLGFANPAGLTGIRLLRHVDQLIEDGDFDGGLLTDLIAEEFYRDEVEGHIEGLPTSVRMWIPGLG